MKHHNSKMSGFENFIEDSSSDDGSEYLYQSGFDHVNGNGTFNLATSVAGKAAEWEVPKAQQRKLAREERKTTMNPLAFVAYADEEGKRAQGSPNATNSKSTCTNRSSSPFPPPPHRVHLSLHAEYQTGMHRSGSLRNRHVHGARVPRRAPWEHPLPL